MTPQKLNVAIAFFAYGGNGGISSEVPDVRDWWAETLYKMRTDERLAEINSFTISDTPITLSRNASVLTARQLKADILVMVDSDMKPDSQLGKHPTAVPFWDTAITFLYDNYAKGPHVIGVPYCGPPPHECVYVFRWKTQQSAHQDPRDMKLEMYSREEAAVFSGIGSVAALPTGLIAYDMRIFEVTDPKNAVNDMLKAGVSQRRAQLLVSSWFDYEWADIWHSKKASTEDVVNTRDMSLTAQTVLGYNPLYCAWDCWAGHWKPKCVDKPAVIGVDEISEKYQHAIRTGLRSNETIKHFKMPQELANRLQTQQGREDAGRYVAATLPPKNGDSVSDDVMKAGHPKILRDDWYPKVKIGFETAAADLCELQRLVREHANGTRGLHVAEIGCWVGGSTLAIARGLRDASVINTSRIACVDHFEGSATDKTAGIAVQNGGRHAIEKAFRTNIEYINDVVLLAVMDSASASARFANRGDLFNIIFIDADHSYDGCYADLQAWYPLLSEGGIICGHDYNDNFPGVKMAVEEYFGKGAAKVESNIWSVQKPTADGMFDKAAADLEKAILESEAGA